MNRRIESAAAAFGFLWLNCVRAPRLFPLAQAQDAGDGISIRQFELRDHQTIVELQRSLGQGAWGGLARLLLRWRGRRCCLVAEADGGRIAGFAFFYFNQRDLRENTVHEGFIGVREEFSGRGLATRLRRAAVTSFSRVPGLKGLSSRIDMDNVASIRSGEKIGYELVEVYRDSRSGKQRGYYVLKF